MHTHLPPASLLRHPVHVAVIGCGGTGSAILGGLPYLDQALRVYGHPAGLRVSAYDGDRVSPTNCVRQPFALTEVGLHKSVVLVHRLNLFWGLHWEAIPEPLTPTARGFDRVDIVISCVDTRAARRVINTLVTDRSATVHYWLDLGNDADTGQFILGQPLNSVNRRARLRLRTVAELYPSILDACLDPASGPSCSDIEALERQHPFLNATLAQHALVLLTRLFRTGIPHHGAFVNLTTGRVMPAPIDPLAWERAARRYRRARRRQGPAPSSPSLAEAA